jgi:hypothetical protein
MGSPQMSFLPSAGIESKGLFFGAIAEKLLLAPLKMSDHTRAAIWT